MAKQVHRWPTWPRRGAWPPMGDFSSAGHNRARRGSRAPSTPFGITPRWPRIRTAAEPHGRGSIASVDPRPWRWLGQFSTRWRTGGGPALDGPRPASESGSPLGLTTRRSHRAKDARPAPSARRRGSWGSWRSRPPSSPPGTRSGRRRCDAVRVGLVGRGPREAAPPRRPDRAGEPDRGRPFSSAASTGPAVGWVLPRVGY